MEQELEFKILEMMINKEWFYIDEKYKVSILDDYQARVELYQYPNKPKTLLLFELINQNDTDFLIGLKALYVEYNDLEYAETNEVYQKLVEINCSVPLKGLVLFINTYQKYVKRVPLALRLMILELLKN